MAPVESYPGIRDKSTPVNEIHLCKPCHTALFFSRIKDVLVEDIIMNQWDDINLALLNGNICQSLTP